MVILLIRLFVHLFLRKHPDANRQADEAIESRVGQ